ncbi:MAG TPA: ATP-grasp domain-containing protein [Geopsychrobacteraceae bacterium]|jgi:D-alanine-D-alanine ligase
MRVAVCYNQAPAVVKHGEARDLIAEAGAFEQARAVDQALRELGYRTGIIPLADSLNDFLRRLEQFAPTVVFNLCEGFRGNARQEMNVAGVFELLGVPFTGSPPLCLGISQDKPRTKALLTQKGLPTPPSCLALPHGKFPEVETLKFPLIVKPPYEDASQGIETASVVDDKRALMKRIRYIHEVYQQPALVEEFIVGRELNVAILGDGKLTVLPVAEITFAADLPRAMVCFDSKWSPRSAAWHGTRPVCPADLTAKEILLVNMIALRTFKLLGCRDYARVDIRLRNFTPFILEVNANPDLSPDAGLARAAAAAKLSYPKLIERILGCAVKRKENSHAGTQTQ